jgi:hypothetical protein
MLSVVSKMDEFHIATMRNGPAGAVLRHVIGEAGGRRASKRWNTCHNS